MGLSLTMSLDNLGKFFFEVYKTQNSKSISVLILIIFLFRIFILKNLKWHISWKRHNPFQCVL